MSNADVLILGSGIGGLMTALRAADHGTVLVLTKKRAEDSSTNWAQGGIAAVFSKEDSFTDHERDLPELLLVRRALLDTRREHLDRLLEAALAGIDLAVARGHFQR